MPEHVTPAGHKIDTINYITITFSRDEARVTAACIRQLIQALDGNADWEADKEHASATLQKIQNAEWALVDAARAEAEQ